MLASDDTGTGPATLLLHPFPFDRRFWAPTVRRLGGGLRTIVPDLRGMGASPAGPPWSMDAYADDCAELLQHLGTGPAVVCGVSLGGYVAFALWRRHPELVRGLMLAHTRAEADTPEAAAARLANIELVRAHGVAPLAERLLPALLGRTTHAERPEVVAEARALLARAPADGVIGALEALRTRPDSVPTLATITVPTVVVSGDEDTLTPPPLQQVIADGVRGAQRLVLPKVGHLGPLEDPRRFAGLLQAFAMPLAG
jgi:pimeloyl-ACP methyl ester carboxylesterase